MLIDKVRLVAGLGGHGELADLTSLDLDGVRRRAGNLAHSPAPYRGIERNVTFR
jgi:hypothetical protein